MNQGLHRENCESLRGVRSCSTTQDSTSKAIQNAAPAEQEAIRTPDDSEGPDGRVYVPSGSTQIGIETERWVAIPAHAPDGAGGSPARLL